MDANAPSVGLVVVAAGSSRRMGGVDKLWVEIEGEPLLAHTLRALTAIPEIGPVVLVASPQTTELVAARRTSQPWSRLTAIVPGGAERADSVYAGLSALPPCEIVLIHDGARPLVRPALLRAAIGAAQEQGAAIPAIAVTDTIKQVDAGGRIVATPDRAVLRAVQTPQAFRYQLLWQAYQWVGTGRTQCTDDAMICERAGIPVFTFPGDPQNIKVSTPADLPLVGFYLRAPLSDQEL